MAIEVTVPEMGESILEATVSHWLKKEGEYVNVGDVLVELETDKVNVEVGAKGAGVLQQIKVQEATLSGEIDTTVSFDERAIDEIIRKAVRTGQQAGALAFQLVKRLEYGLKLVKDRSGMEHFVITPESVTDMEKYINDLVKKFYRNQLS